MSYVYFQNNPCGRSVGDCAVRAISKAFDYDWEKAYIELTSRGLWMCDMPSSDSVWGAFLREKGMQRHNIPNSCPDCYRLKDFCREYPKGIYVVKTSNHVVTVVDGDYFDSWDSGNEIPTYYWR